MKPFDIQVNGYAGVDFCSSDLTDEQLHRACRELRSDGVDRILATVITDTVDRLAEKLANLARLRSLDPLAREVIAGFHIEGPFLQPRPGYAGAHDAAVMLPATVADAQRLIDASQGLARLVTLAPECDPGGETTRYLVEQGIVVSAGHCDPTLDELHGAIDSGLSMVTHFGNGCPVELDRHDNVLQRFLHFRDRLWFGLIPDGWHIDFVALKNYIDFVGVERSIIVTDAIAAARLGPGRYQLSGQEVEVDAQGVARRPGSANLAGSTITMPTAIENLRETLGFSDREVSRMVDENPRSALDLPE